MPHRGSNVFNPKLPKSIEQSQAVYATRKTICTLHQCKHMHVHKFCSFLFKFRVQITDASESAKRAQHGDVFTLDSGSETTSEVVYKAL